MKSLLSLLQVALILTLSLVKAARPPPLLVQDLSDDISEDLPALGKGAALSDLRVDRPQAPLIKQSVIRDALEHLSVGAMRADVETLSTEFTTRCESTLRCIYTKLMTSSWAVYLSKVGQSCAL
jgi:hypothetical protein